MDETCNPKADQKLARQMQYRRGKVSIEEVIKKMCKEGGIREEEVKDGSQRKRVSEGKDSPLFKSGGGDFHGRDCKEFGRKHVSNC